MALLIELLSTCTEELFLFGLRVKGTADIVNLASRYELPRGELDIADDAGARDMEKTLDVGFALRSDDELHPGLRLAPVK